MPPNATKRWRGLGDSERRFRGLAAELAQANAERLRLLRRTVAAQEAERARVARELHDSLGQYVTALRLGLKAAEPRCARLIRPGANSLRRWAR